MVFRYKITDSRNRTEYISNTCIEWDRTSADNRTSRQVFMSWSLTVNVMILSNSIAGGMLKSKTKYYKTKITNTLVTMIQNSQEKITNKQMSQTAEPHKMNRVQN